MLAFSVIKIEQHRATYGSAGDNSALLREMAATPHKSAPKPRRSSEITTGSMIPHMATASLRRGAACCARSSLPQSPAREHPAPNRLIASDLRSRLSANRVKLNRQIQEVEHPVTYRKQTTVSCSNRQKNKKWTLAISMPPCARVTYQSASAVSLTPRKAAVTLPHWHLWGRANLRVSGFAWIIGMMAAAAFVSGCAVSHKTVVKPGDAPAKLLTASKDDLIRRYNQQAQSVMSLNATVSMKLTAGSAYSGVIEQYHEVNGFILAAKPANIRVIGQAPVVSKNVFDMVSDGETFRIYIPSKNKFITGPARFEKKAEKPIENLRPQHLVDALFWREIPAGAPVIFEEMEDAAGRAYLLTVLRRGEGEGNFIVVSVVRFDRSDLNVSEIENFTGDGILTSVSHYADWQAAGAAAQFPRSITVSRPRDDYKLGIQIKKLTLNETIAPERFHLEQPAGSELVDVGKEDQGVKP